jgi:hypothetical protein
MHMKADAAPHILYAELFICARVSLA